MAMTTVFSILTFIAFVSANVTSIKPCFDGTCSKCSDDVYNVTAGVPYVTQYDTFTEKNYQPSNT